jgi:hypothetical protein
VKEKEMSARDDRADPQSATKARCEAHRSNENKMSDGGRERASLGVEVWKSSQKWSARRSAVRSIAWLGLFIVKTL